MSDVVSEPTDQLDESVLAQIDKVGGQDLMKRLFEMFLELNPVKLVAIREGAEQGNLDAVRRAAHSMRSSCGNLGAKDLSEVNRKLEAASLNGDLGTVRSLLGAVEDEFASVESALRRRLKEMGA